MDEERKFLLAACIMFLLIISAAIAYSYAAFSSSVKSMGLIDNKNQDLKGMFGFLYSNYTAYAPSTDYRYYYGNEKASITIVAFNDLSSSSSKKFMKEVFPQIKSEYLDNGNARFYPKYALTKEDFAERNERFIYAQSFACFEDLDKARAFDFYLKLADISSSSEIPRLVDEFNISNKTFSECIDSREFPEIKQDMLEMDRLGIVGLNQIFYIGILGRDNKIVSGSSGFDVFRRTIRQYQIQVGD
jgi:hypothetical protein